MDSKTPIDVFPASTNASFTRETMLANVAADADVPPANLVPDVKLGLNCS